MAVKGEEIEMVFRRECDLTLVISPLPPCCNVSSRGQTYVGRVDRAEKQRLAMWCLQSADIPHSVGIPNNGFTVLLVSYSASDEGFQLTSVPLTSRLQALLDVSVVTVVSCPRKVASLVSDTSPRL